MCIRDRANAAIADIFSASAVLVVGGLIFVGIVVVSLGSASLRELYFPSAEATMVSATAD